MPMKCLYGSRLTDFSYCFILLIAFSIISCSDDDRLPKTPSNTVQKELKKEEKVDTIMELNNKKIIYLTFDDGPNLGTENVLRVIREKNIYATSFVIGAHVYGSKKQSDTWESMQNDTLIELANHSYHHAYNKFSNYYKNSETVLNDFNKAKDSLKLNSYIARTPGRNIWRISPSLDVTDIKTSKEAADYLQQNGYTLVGWDLEWHANDDMKLKYSHEKMLEKINSMFKNNIERTSNHMVILMHDQFFQDEDSISELDKLIDELMKNDEYEFRKISDYPNIKSMHNPIHQKM